MRLIDNIEEPELGDVGHFNTLKSFSYILQSKLVYFKSSCEIFLKWKVFYLKCICLKFNYFLNLVQASCIHISQLIAEH